MSFPLPTPFPGPASSLISGRTGGAASTLLGNEWDGMAIDFIANDVVVRDSNNAEMLLGATFATQEAAGLALDFLDNSYAVRY